MKKMKIRKSRKFFPALIILICFNIGLKSQSMLTIKGKVTDEKNNPIPYVNVFIKDTFIGAMTKNDGNFTFSTKKKGKIILIASMVGYKKYEKEFLVDTLGNSFIKIVLIKTTLTTDVVLVTSSSYGTEKKKGLVITKMDVITTPGGAADIFQSLKTLPGLTQVSESAELYVRGGDPGETITLLDQASLYHPYTYESSYGGLFSNLNTNTIKGMFFSSGGFSVKYGNALSGVLDLSTYDNLPTNRNYSFGLSLAGVSVSAATPIVSSKLGVSLNARQNFTEPIFWLNGNFREFTLLPRSSDADVSLTYKYSKTGRVKIFGSIANDKEGVNVHLPGYTNEFKLHSANNLFNLQLKDVIFNNTVIKTSLSRTFFKSKWRLGILDLNRKDVGLKFRLDTETIFSPLLKLFAGTEIENRKVKFEGVIPQKDYDLRNNAKGELLDATFDVTRTGGYVEIAISNLFGLEKLYLIAGTRLDYVAPLGLMWFDPRANIGYKITDKLTFTLGVGIFHQHPNPRFYSPADGNPALKPMRAVHLIASVNYKFLKNENFRIEFYNKKYSNLPLKDAVLNYNNNGFGFARGIDLMLKGKLFGIIDGWVSYGFINTKRYWLDFKKLTSSSFDITHNFALVAKYNITASFQVGINFKYATGRPFSPVVSSVYIPAQNIYKPVYGKKNSTRFPDYKRLDLRLTYLTRIFGKYFTVIYIEGLNIFNIKNIFGYSYNKDYSIRKPVSSYFGRRTIVFGIDVDI